MLNWKFEAGVPVAVNGEKLSPAALLEKLNEIGIRNGVGICDMVENRLVGMKSRGVYENPGGAIIVYAHKEPCQDCALTAQPCTTKK